jgi:hypothetical protein
MGHSSSVAHRRRSRKTLRFELSSDTTERSRERTEDVLWFFTRVRSDRGAFLTYEKRPLVFLTYHDFLTITSSSRIISRDCLEVIVACLVRSSVRPVPPSSGRSHANRKERREKNGEKSPTSHALTPRSPQSSIHRRPPSTSHIAMMLPQPISTYTATAPPAVSRPALPCVGTSFRPSSKQGHPPPPPPP